MPKVTKKRKKTEAKESPFSERLEECFSIFKSLHEEIEERIDFLQQKEALQENLQKEVQEAFKKTKSQITSMLEENDSAPLNRLLRQLRTHTSMRCYHQISGNQMKMENTLSIEIRNTSSEL
eukprot:TRINITY_DN1866_c1_g1_i3.p1 TRINITY_DN1866_c1_g1~~TRINITY_DN1866_c1_g1_i3.p1  ORF type:complete len:122 (-),score=20.65 TRINITY_DN1866_c1_g1_i3:617-982(-)